MKFTSLFAFLARFSGSFFDLEKEPVCLAVRECHNSVIQAALIQEKIVNTHDQNPVFCVVRSGTVPGDNDPFEKVVDPAEGLLDLTHPVFIRERIGGLDVIPCRFPAAHEVDLQLPADDLSLFVFKGKGSDACVNLKTADQKLIINHVFHNPVFPDLAEPQTGVAEADIREVILDGGADVFPAPDIVSLGDCNE